MTPWRVRKVTPWIDAIAHLHRDESDLEADVIIAMVGGLRSRLTRRRARRSGTWILPCVQLVHIRPGFRVVRTA